MRIAHDPDALQFRLDRRSGVPYYRQLVDQVRFALELGILRRGDKLPTLSEVVGQLAINPNTVHRAYQELELQGWTEGRPGIGTFVVKSRGSGPSRRKALQGELEGWVSIALESGLDGNALKVMLDEAIKASKRGERP
jgi:GntR family transcriptional regulator